MRRLIFAATIVIFGGITFVAGTPARAFETGTLNEISTALPGDGLTKVQWYGRRCYRCGPHWRHRHWRHRHWRHRHWYYPRCRRYCRWRHGHWRCYRRCWRR